MAAAPFYKLVPRGFIAFNGCIVQVANITHVVEEEDGRVTIYTTGSNRITIADAGMVNIVDAISKVQGGK